MRIDIIGRGNVATHLAKAFDSKSDVNIVVPRSFEGLRCDSDLYLISVSDDAITSTAERLSVAIGKSNSAVVAHTSGCTPLCSIGSLFKNPGVFYPLQTFSKHVELNYREIPFFLEGDNDYTRSILLSAANLISDNVSFLTTDQRQDLHVASAFACNFVNRLWALSYQYLEDKNIDFKSMLPLIKETLRKIESVKPIDAQTGPAARKDMRTISAHLDKLKEYPEMSAIYSMLTDSIIKSKND